MCQVPRPRDPESTLLLDRDLKKWIVSLSDPFPPDHFWLYYVFVISKHGFMTSELFSEMFFPLVRKTNFLFPPVCVSKEIIRDDDEEEEEWAFNNGSCLLQEKILQQEIGGVLAVSRLRCCYAKMREIPNPLFLTQIFRFSAF